MVSKQIRLPIFCSLFLLLVLAGCSSTNPQSNWLHEQAQDSISDSTAEIQDPDLTEIESASEVCLDQELEALRLTGAWDDPQSYTSQQTSAGDLGEPETSFDFPITVNRQVEVYIDLFQRKQRKYFGRWLARSGYYLPMMQKELEEMQHVLSKDALERRQFDFLEARGQLENDSRGMEQQVKLDRARLLKPLQDKFVSTVERVGRDNAFSIILLRTAPGIIYSREALDITALVVEQFNAVKAK
jgi:Skp family chaperone for outer membrane proteins